MPLVTVQMLEGRSSDTKRTLIRRIGEALTATLNVPEEAIRITLLEVAPENWGVGCHTMAELRSGQRSDGGAS